LVADDNEFNLLTFRQIIKSNYGLHSDGATNGQEAVEKFKRSLDLGSPYRVIFMDVSMPIKDGLDATREILSILNQNPEHPEIKIVALTANDTEQEKQRCLAAGMSSFLSKPPDVQRLKQTLKEVFGEGIR
jgi:CheY-like chemotaxis protein